MGNLVSSLGIEWKELIAQAINFGLLVFILTKFLYKPVMKSIEEKERSIQGVKDGASKMEKMLQENSEAQKKVLDKARLESEKIIKNAETSASILKKNLLEEAKHQAEIVISQGEQKIREENEKLRRDIKKEVGTLVSDAIEKTVGKYIDEKAKHSLKDEASKEFSKIIA
ncbi:MAG: F0F1 ATP synthase subunit B [bacterium]